MLLLSKNQELRIKDLLQEQGLRMSDLAERLGTNQSNLTKSLANNPKLSTLQEVAKALGVEVNELFTPSAPSRPKGLAVIGGKTYGMMETNVVQLPLYMDYASLRKDVKRFVNGCFDGKGTGAFCAIVSGLEIATIVYDKEGSKFFLALFYGDGESKTCIYDMMEYAEWQGAEAFWNPDDIIADIQADIENITPSDSVAE